MRFLSLMVHFGEPFVDGRRVCWEVFGGTSIGFLGGQRGRSVPWAACSEQGLTVGGTVRLLLCM